MKTLTETTIQQDRGQLGLLLSLIMHEYGQLEPEELQQLLQTEFGVYYSIQDIIYFNNVGVEEEDLRLNLGNCGINY